MPSAIRPVTPGNLAQVFSNAAFIHTFVAQHRPDPQSAPAVPQWIHLFDAVALGESRQALEKVLAAGEHADEVAGALAGGEAIGAPLHGRPVCVIEVGEVEGIGTILVGIDEQGFRDRYEAAGGMGATGIAVDQLWAVFQDVAAAYAEAGDDELAMLTWSW